MEPQPGELPIFVVGFQRSGTTLFQALLGAHPRIAAPPETYFIYRVADHADYFGDLADDANLRRALHEALNPGFDMFAGCGFEFDSLFDQARRRPRTYAALFDTILTDFARRQGKARWSEKSPGQPIDSIYALYPNAQVIHLVRDPRDVVASSLEVPWTDADAAGGLARGWRAFTLRAIRRGLEAGPARFLQIRYEDLTHDPEAVLRVVCAFLHEDFTPQMLDQAARNGTVPDAAKDWQGRALRRIEHAAEGGWKERLKRGCSSRQRSLRAPGARADPRRAIPAGPGVPGAGSEPCPRAFDSASAGGCDR
jgi:hypothetical protein